MTPAAGRTARSLCITVDVVLLTVRDGRLQVLLVRRGTDPARTVWALPGTEPGVREPLEAAAARAVAGVTALPVHLEQLRTYGDPDRAGDERVVSTAYLGLVPGLPAPMPFGGAALWPVPAPAPGPDGEGSGVRDGPVDPPLALDHAVILADGIERARSKLEYTCLASAFVTEPFTLGDLRAVYEAVWGAPLDPGNFRRKVLSTHGFVEPLTERAAPRPGGGRPARLYRRGRSRLLHPAMLRPSRGSQATRAGTAR